MEPTPPSVEVWSLHYWIVREVPYLAMTNNTYLNIHIQVSMWTYAFIFFLSFFFFGWVELLDLMEVYVTLKSC